MTILSISSAGTSARISTYGGCIQRLDKNGVPLMRPAADDALPIDSACYPLVPFGNRVRGNRFSFAGEDHALTPNTDWDSHYLHGEGWRSEWAVVETASHRIVLTHGHDGSALPYRYDAKQAFEVTPEGMIMSISVTNRGRPMPFGIGWHPHFPLTPRTTLHTQTGAMWSEEEGWLPGSPGPVPSDLDFSAPRELPRHWVNNAFEGWSGRATINWPERDLLLQIDADPVFTTMFLFVSDTSFDPGYKRDFFALEPMSHLADGHNQADLGGLRVLEADETLWGSLCIKAV
ncbi:aldose 1-epimerase [Chelativorans sp. AA-79]|uniref:aldose 1-epimerase n=1 Tax=Chelativorans sp. AA-79 TaxID=3028735 RepID=UPI0023F9B430|nr:aldose 1-epimerase [Chelativorans sp. AA-79]WEX08996.1 aldose 1-epimerase [Chelativorans sp. AA-79]